MKKNLFFLVIILITLASSCIKDRLQPAAGPVVTSAGDTLMYFWNFNRQDSSVRTPDFSAHGTGAANYNYSASYLDFTTGTSVNLKGTTDSGDCLRVRNPSNFLIFNMPSTGFDSLIFSFAVQASSSGPSQCAITYTTDGVTYGSKALSNNQYAVTTSFALQTFSFAADPAVNNNPKFAVKITFNNNNTGTSGNDRYDNVSLSGVRK